MNTKPNSGSRTNTGTTPSADGRTVKETKPTPAPTRAADLAAQAAKHAADDTEKARQEYARAAKKAFSAVLEHQLSRVTTASLATLPDAEEVGRTVADFVRPTNPMAKKVGPVYDTKAVTKITGWSRQQIDDRRKRGTILALKTSDERWAYPTWQFNNGVINPRVREVLDILRPVDPSWWTVAVWFTTPKDALNGTTPANWIKANHDLDHVLRLTHAAARRWAA